MAPTDGMRRHRSTLYLLLPMRVWLGFFCHAAALVSRFFWALAFYVAAKSGSLTGSGGFVILFLSLARAAAISRV